MKMIERTGTSLAAVLLIGALVAGCGSSGSKASRETTLRLHGTRSGVDVAASGAYKRWIYSAPLTDASGGTAGRADVFCTSTARPSLDLCTATVALPRGTVAAQGLVRDAAGGTLSLDGGTGAYAGAGGRVVTSGPNAREARLVLDIFTR